MNKYKYKYEQIQIQICVLLLFSTTVYSSNYPMPSDNNYSITTFKLFVISLNYFTSFKIKICIS